MEREKTNDANQSELCLQYTFVRILVSNCLLSILLAYNCPCDYCAHYQQNCEFVHDTSILALYSNCTVWQIKFTFHAYWKLWVLRMSEMQYDDRILEWGKQVCHWDNLLTFNHLENCQNIQVNEWHQNQARSGRSRKTTVREDNALWRMTRRYAFSNSSIGCHIVCFQQELCLIDWSHLAIRSIKRPLLTPCHKAARLQMCQARQRLNLSFSKKVHWSDNLLYITNGRMLVWRNLELHILLKKI